jgi:hypothetical protein
MRPFIFSVFILFSCSTHGINENVLNDTIQVQSATIDVNYTHASETDDCVFDTSTFKFTTEVLHKFNPELKYRWIEKEAQAIVPFEQGDTLLLHIGGCNHFSYHAIYITSDSIFNNESYLFEKVEWIAKNFFANGFDDGFVHYIRNKKYKLEKDTDKIRSYSILTDSTTSEIDIYDGFSIRRKGNQAIIELIGYTN